MAHDIFSRRTDVFGGSFASDEATISFPKSGLPEGGDVGLLIQQLQITYRQQVTRLYEVGHPAIYYVGGRTNGDVAMNRVIGPITIAKEFYTQFGDVCQARSNTLAFSIEAGCGTDLSGGQFRGYADYTAHFCVITSLGIGVTAENMLINENLALMFSSFEYTKEGTG